MKRALVLGIGGQDGSYLADILLEKQYEVHGLHRHSSCDNLWRIRHCTNRVTLHRGDVIDQGSIRRTIFQVKPDAIFNCADQDNVAWSHEVPRYQELVTSEAVGELLSWLVEEYANGPVRVFQPLSCTMFGGAPPPQAEDTPLAPHSPYAQEKAKAWSYCQAARKRGLFVSCGIMFNHDSPRRAAGYLLQDVCRQAVEVARGRRERVTVRDLRAEVDVGFAGEYMGAAVAMLRRPIPGDWCIGTGVAWTVELMCRRALQTAAFLVLDGSKFPEHRLTELIHAPMQGPDTLQPTYRADVAKARADLGFDPKVGPGELIEMLVKHFQEQP